MRFGSVCSGIEAASVAWGPMGWEAAWLSEIEPFPSAVLAHHYPDVPNLGDMTTLPERILSDEVEAPDLFCGGTPCQAFSVAGLRKSLDDARGNLSLVFCEIANAIDHVRLKRGYQPTVVFWENVPGVLNTKDNAFGCFLAGLAGEDDPLEPPGGRWTNAGAVFGPKRAVAWRVTDAQYFGVAQRRRRVFVVASSRDDVDPVKVLFEFDGLRRDSAPSREAGKDAAGCPASRTGGGGFPGTDEACSGYKGDFESETFLVQGITHTLRGEGFDASEDGTGRVRLRNPGMGMIKDGTAYNLMASGQPHAVVAFDATQITSAANRSNPQPGSPCHPLAAGAHAPAIAFSAGDFGGDACLEVSPTLRKGGDGGGNQPAIAFSSKDYGADATTDLAPILRAMNHAESHANGGGQMAVAYTTKLHNTQSNQAGKVYEEYATSLDANSPPPAVFAPVAQFIHANKGRPNGRQSAHTEMVSVKPLVETLTTDGHAQSAVFTPATQVRRLTPRECERLQGFPDNYTQIPWRKKPASECPDGPRYKALGNSWAVPNVRWIGQRIDNQIIGDLI